MLTYQVAAPSAKLSHLVLRYYDIHGQSNPENPYRLNAFPLVNTSWVLHYGEVITARGEYYPEGNQLPRYYTLGQFNKPIFIRHDQGTVGVFGVVFRAGTAFYLNGVPQHEFTNRSIDMADIYGKKIHELVERLALAADIQERVAIVEEFIISRISATHTANNIIDDVVYRVVRNGGQVKVAQLAEAYKTHRSYLTRKFKVQTGMGIKEFARIVRFNHAFAYWKQFPDTRISDLAAIFGYYDFSHLVKDFEAFTGAPHGLSNLDTSANELASFLANQQ